MEQKKKKGLVAGIAAVIAVALAFIMLAPAAADEQFDSASTSSVVMLHPEGDFALSDDAGETETKKKKSGAFSTAARWILRTVKTAFVSLCLGTVSLVIKLLGALAGTAGGGIGAALGFILGDLLPVFFLVLLVFCFLFKLIYPDIDLRQFLSFKNILVMAAGSFVISVFIRFSAERIENRVLASELNLAVSVLVIFFLWLIMFKGEFVSQTSRVRLLSEPRAYILLFFLIGTAFLVGRAGTAISNSGGDMLLLIKLLDCAWFCFILISVAAYIYRHTGARRKKQEAV